MMDIAFGKGLAVSLALSLLVSSAARAHMPDRPDLNSWFAGLRAGGTHAMCCSFADAETVADPEWDTKDGHYRVFLDKHWIDVPDRAVVDVPNKYGPALVWPLRYPEGGEVYDIRCFLPGAGT